MNFTAYIERQKTIIRRRHTGDMFLIKNGEAIPLPDDRLFGKACKVLSTEELLEELENKPMPSTEELLEELEGMRGLNKLERNSFSSRFKSW